VVYRWESPSPETKIDISIVDRPNDTCASLSLVCSALDTDPSLLAGVLLDHPGTNAVCSPVYDDDVQVPMRNSAPGRPCSDSSIWDAWLPTTSAAGIPALPIAVDQTPEGDAPSPVTVPSVEPGVPAPHTIHADQIPYSVTPSPVAAPPKDLGASGSHTPAPPVAPSTPAPAPSGAVAAFFDELRLPLQEVPHCSNRLAAKAVFRGPNLEM
jgi:hypothetical protein